MRGFLAIYRRELGGIFMGPLAWTLLVIAYALQGLLYLVYLKTSQGDVDLELRFAFGESWAFWALAALFPPLLTMRMISEESRMGLLEYLLTAPVTDVAVVLGGDRPDHRLFVGRRLGHGGTGQGEKQQDGKEKAHRGSRSGRTVGTGEQSARATSSGLERR